MDELGEAARLASRLRPSEELAARADLHRNDVGRVERGERDIGIVAPGRLATALRTSLAEFFAPFRTKLTR